MSNIETQSIIRQFVVVNSNKPTSPFEGQLWRDTSTDTLKQYNGSAWVSIQSSPDGTTIWKNQDGEIEVLKSGLIDGNSIFLDNNNQMAVKPSNKVLGRWNNGTGDFTVQQGLSGSVNLSIESESAEGSGSLHFRYAEGDYPVTIGKSVDLTDLDTLEFYYFLANDTYEGDTGSILAFVGGSQVFSDSSWSYGTWYKASVDISGYSGEQMIEIGFNGAYSAAANFDYLRVFSSSGPVIDQNVGDTGE